MKVTVYPGLAEQKGQPAPDDGLQISANLVDETMAPEQEGNVPIGSRVRVVFGELEYGLTLPQFALSSR